MGALLATLFDIAHIAAAGSAIILALWLASHPGGSGKLHGAASVACGLSALWALASVAVGSGTFIVELFLSGTYLSWLWFLYRLFGHDERDKSVAPVRPVVAALAFVELLQIAMTVSQVHYGAHPVAQDLFRQFSVMFRLLFVIGALVLVHNLYAGAAQQVRQSLRWPAAALGCMLLYDLNLFTVSYLGGGEPATILALRCVAMLAMITMLALGTVRNERDLRFQPSRSFAFRSFSLMVIGGYLIVMIVIAQAISYAGSEFTRFVQVGFIVLASALALAFLPSKKLRGWLRVTISKHLFQHRYDYRSEWLRFTDTIGRAGPQAAPLHERAVQAVADITDSPSGLLLVPREEGGLVLDARWNWQHCEVPTVAMTPEGVRFFEQSQFIVDLDDLRSGREVSVPIAASTNWLMQDHDAWAIVPLLHFERLVGIVVLSRPPVARKLDWEDFDLLRIIGRQLASYLAEQSSQDALGEAQRFDEFNRRIAFVMHDIKNLASQLSLLARNAEKHADKAEFRADMILTLRNSTDKLQALLDRLGRYGGQTGGERQEIRLDQVIGRVAAQFRGKHDLIALDRDVCRIMADADALEQALVHLVQNAIDASSTGTPVFLDMRKDHQAAIVEIVDSGRGMSPEFMRSKLFKPFHSSKAGGFGIGAFEARELIRGMGGQLDVESREDIGTRFIVRFPLAGAPGVLKTLQEISQNQAEVA